MAEHDHPDTPLPDEIRAQVLALLPLLDAELVVELGPLIVRYLQPRGRREGD